MSYSGGTFSINTAGQPVVAGTTISDTVFNALTADLATGLSTCVLKDGTQTTTALIPFAEGVALASTKRLYLDGVGGTGDTYIVESAANTLGLVVGGTTAFSFTTVATLGMNVSLGANYISRAGTAAGFSLDASNNATLSGTLTVSGTGTNTFLASLTRFTPSAGENVDLARDGSGPYMGTSSNHAYSIITNNTRAITISTAQAVTLADTLTVSGNQVLGSAAGTLRATDGVRIGADSTNNLLDDASTGAGTATLYIGNASINVTSDENVKSNITPLEDGLSIINALQPIEFDQDEERPWGDQRHYMGFGARASHKVAPWAVHTQGDTGLPWKMRQEFLMAPTVRAVQQLAERLAKLEARLA